MELKQALILLFAGAAGTCGFALLFRMRKKLIPWAILGSLLTLAVYVICLRYLQHAFYQNLLPALCGALYAEVLARLTRSPATQYLVGAIIPLVPGGGLYYTMYDFVTEDMAAFRTELLHTAHTAAGLAVGIILVSVLMHQVRYHSLKTIFEEE